MNLKFLTPDTTDKRVKFASEYLENQGLINVKSLKYADFVLLGVNPDKELTECNIPVFAGNVSGDNVCDYTKNEEFCVKNAYLTAEAALSLIIKNSEKSLINSQVLVTGYGRIAKALHGYLRPFTNNVTVCARSCSQRAEAEVKGARSINFNSLKNNSEYDFIINTVPHPVFLENELYSVNSDALIVDLASFPGGVDTNIARVKKLRLITARGLPGVYSPEAAGRVLGETLIEIINSSSLFKKEVNA